MTTTNTPETAQEAVMTESNLVNHARRELALIGEDQWVTDGIVSVVQAFADCGHSGGSAPMAIAYLEKLLRFEPLSPITNDPAEWIDRTEISGYPFWQSLRNSKAFSEDGGKTYWLLSERNAAGSEETTPQAHQAGRMTDETPDLSLDDARHVPHRAGAHGEGLEGLTVDAAALRQIEELRDMKWTPATGKHDGSDPR